MATEALDSGPVGPSDTTVDLAAATNDDAEDEGHEPCYLFSEEHSPFLVETNIKILRLGVAAACLNCSIVLDAVTTYSSERLCINSIKGVSVLSHHGRINLTIEERKGVHLDSFRLKGKLYTCHFVCFQQLGQSRTFGKDIPPSMYEQIRNTFAFTRESTE